MTGRNGKSKLIFNNKKVVFASVSGENYFTSPSSFFKFSLSVKLNNR
jgi:hypothetical protein